jgi:hypothetical protein
VRTVNTTSTSQAKTGDASSRHSRRSRSSYRYETRIRRYKYLLAGISILFLMTYVFTWFYAARKSAESEQALLELRIQKKTLNTINDELETVRAERDALVQGRLPGLLPLTYDETITTDNKYIRNIIFTMVKNGQKETYEYRLVMQNDTLSVIHPIVEILLFNDIGIQIGLAQVEHTDASTMTGRAALDPGEVRSFTAAIDLVREEQPHYFLLAVSEAEQASADKLREQLGDVISP